jgi:hypothetical protein
MIQELVKDGFFGPVRCDGREILQRLFVSVRDRAWSEVVPTVWQVDLSEYTAAVRGRHRGENVDFEWTGSLSCTEDRRDLQFAFQAAARADSSSTLRTRDLSRRVT